MENKINEVPLEKWIEIVKARIQLGNRSYPVREFESDLTSRGMTAKQARKISGDIIQSGQVRWEVFANKFVPLSD